MTVLSKGANAPLDSSDVTVTLTAPEPVDVSAVLLGADGRVRSDADFVFFNQPTAPGVNLDVAGRTVRLSLASVDTQVQTVAILASLDGSGSATFGGLGGPLVIEAHAGQVVRYEPAGLGAESALLAVEVYRRGAQWKVRAVGQGWDDGLAGLARSFGVVVDDEPAPAPAPPPPPIPHAAPAPPPQAVPPPQAAPPRQAAPPPPQAPAPPVSMSKVELRKRGEARTVDLTKSGAAVTPLRFNLNWKRPRWGAGTDLDLGCMLEMDDGDKTVIQPLGNSFGSARDWPWILLDADDRTGARNTGENLTIHRPDKIRRVLVFAMVYSGSGFSSVDAVLTMFDGVTETVVRLDSPTPRRAWCAIAMVTRTATGVEIRKEEAYFKGHKDADHQYGFGFTWTAGRK